MDFARIIGKLLTGIVNEHADFVTRLRGFDRVVTRRRQGDFLSAAVEFLEGLRSPLLAHFREEDTLFFPAVLMATDDYRLIRLVLKLHAEHCWFRQELDRLALEFGDSLRARVLPPKRTQAEMRFLIDRLVVHAEVEELRIFARWAREPRYQLALNRVWKQARRAR